MIFRARGVLSDTIKREAILSVIDSVSEIEIRSFAAL